MPFDDRPARAGRRSVWFRGSGFLRLAAKNSAPRLRRASDCGVFQRLAGAFRLHLVSCPQSRGAVMTIARTATIVAALTTALVGQPEYKSWPLSQAPEELRPAISRADVVVVTMQSAVLRELTDALARGGAAGGLGFCHVDVTGIIQRVSREPGVTAGRTSDRLRNPANARMTACRRASS